MTAQSTITTILVSFEEFCVERKPFGLGYGLEDIERIVEERQSNKALDKKDKATKGEHGGDRRSESFNVHNVNIEKRPWGNARQAALRRLRSQRPDLHEKVLAGEISAHGAMVEAGFRPRTATVPVTVDGALKLLGKLNQDDFAEVLQKLNEC